jgi:uracil-DNA glycosylase family 4
MIKTRNSGLKPARIAFVAEAPGREEEYGEMMWTNNPSLAKETRQRRGPLIGSSGEEFDTWLAEMGLERKDVFITNVCKYRPPDNDIEEFVKIKKRQKGKRQEIIPGPEVQEGLKELRDELDYVNPDVIIPMGNIALWALTGHYGITSWRGSILERQQHCGGIYKFETTPCKVIPTYHPAAVLRMWNWRNITMCDLRRAVTEQARGREMWYPKWNFIIRPTFGQTMGTLQLLKSRADAGPLPIADDIETRHGTTACISLTWSKLDSICIPFLDWSKPDRSYFTFDEERQVLFLLRELLTHPNVQLIGQNFIYDIQYHGKEWGIAPRVHFDTMIAQHVAFPGVPKGLDFLSSMYCDWHQYWKDDGKNFEAEDGDYEKWWNYSCRDGVHTFECYEALQNVLTQLNRWEQFNFQMHDLFPEVRGMVFRGIGFDHKLRGQLFSEISQHIADRQRLVNTLIGRSVNARSPKQLQELFYEEFGQKKVLALKTGRPTTDEDALNEICKREPLLKPVCGAINEIRALGSAQGVVMTQLDADGMLRTSYNIAGPHTFRFSSSENAFGGGGNLQNITEGRTSEYTGLKLPNLRRLICPLPGDGILDADLQKADLYVVVWEAEDEDLKRALAKGLDLHLVNARDVYNLGMPDDELVDGTDVCEEHKRRFSGYRKNCKNGIHATDYGARPPKLAKLLGCTVHEADQFQRKWFAKHPGFKRWHERVMSQINASRSVTSRFGYTRHFFDRIEDCFTNALAWVPQNTVAIYINKIIVALRVLKPQVLVRLQTHDSFTATYHQSLHPHIIKEIHPLTRIVVPYDDPLVIPMGYKYSDKSWGDCKSVGELTLD